MSVGETFARRPVVLAVAHPDDETIAAGGLLPRMAEVSIAIATDGAPRNPRFAAAAGFADWRDYAAARRNELVNAMQEAGLPAGRLHFLNVPDQQACLRMRQIADRLLELFERLRPEVALTHAYEGGHPDHDAVAFAVHAACARLRRPPQIWEFAGYHARNGSMAVGEFLIGEEPGETVVLDEEARERKRRMFACYATQKTMLQHFPLDVERFRPAPVYDFLAAPHSGRLLYEQFDWGFEGRRWRDLAAAAMTGLRLEGVL